MKCKKVLALSVVFSLLMANIAYAANLKVEIAYRGSFEDGLEIEYDDGTVKVSKSEAIKKATDLYFNDFLPEMRDYVLMCYHIDVNDINLSNIGKKAGIAYSGKCLADLGEYYYIEVTDYGDAVLVDKYEGTCYSVGGYSLLRLKIADDYGEACWGIQWQ